MLQNDTPKDFVIATNETHSVRKFVEASFREINKEIIWQGEGETEVGIEKGTQIVRIKVDPKYYRPTEVELLLGDSSKAKNELNWQNKIKFIDLVKDMVAADIQLAKMQMKIS